MLNAAKVVKSLCKAPNRTRLKSPTQRSLLAKRRYTTDPPKIVIPRLIVTDQPGFAADLARMLRLSTLDKNVEMGYFGDESTGRDIVAWCFPNSFHIVDPVMNPKKWKFGQLPNFPPLDEVWPTTPEANDSINRVIELMRAADTVICAMEPTSEGQLLFHDLLNHARNKVGVAIPDSKCFRIWPHVKKPDALRSALKSPLPNELFKHISKSAHLRRYIDWSAQFNYTKLYTLLYSRHGSQVFQLSRIQLAILKQITERYLERREFKPKPFYEIHLECLVQGHGLTFRWTRDTSNLVPYEPPSENADPNAPVESESTTIEKPKYLLKKPTRHFATESKEEAFKIANAVEGMSTIVAARAENVHQPPPLLYNLTSLQREAYERYSIPASATHLALLALYEKMHLISNPNTSSHQLPTTKASELKEILQYYASTKKYAPLTRGLVSVSKINDQDGRIFDLSMTEFETHAIIPVATSLSWWTSSQKKGGGATSMTPTMSILYDMIVRRFLASMMPDVIHSVITVTLENADQYYFETSAAILKSEGWRFVGALPRGKAPFKPGPANFPSGYIPAKVGDDESAQDSEITEQKALYKTLAALRPGDEIRGVVPAAVVTKERSPPPLYTQSRALALMEDSCTFVDDRLQYSYGLGTPQERADILTKMIASKWIRSRQDRYLEPSRKGILLTKLTQDDIITDLSNSQSWDTSLNYIARGRGSGTALIKRFKALVEPDLRKHIDAAASSDAVPLQVAYDLVYYHANERAKALNAAPPAFSSTRCPKCNTKGMLKQGPTAFFCASPKCNWSMPQVVAGHQLTTDEAKALLLKQEAPGIAGLVDKAGNIFTATLQLQPPHYQMYFHKREITKKAEASSSSKSASDGALAHLGDAFSGKLDDEDLGESVKVVSMMTGPGRPLRGTRVAKPKKPAGKTGRPRLAPEVVARRLQEKISQKMNKKILQEAQIQRLQHLRENPTPAPIVGIGKDGNPIRRIGRPKLGEYVEPRPKYLARGRPPLTEAQLREREAKKSQRGRGRPTKLQTLRTLALKTSTQTDTDNMQALPNDSSTAKSSEKLRKRIRNSSKSL